MTDTPLSIIGVVDDDQRILESLQSLLESANYDVRLFSSANDLLESRHLADIGGLISDIDMPGMDGFELLRALHSARPDLPIVFITGHPEMLNQLSPTDTGCHGILKKPFDGEVLLKTLAEALQSAALSRSQQ